MEDGMLHAFLRRLREKNSGDPLSIAAEVKWNIDHKDLDQLVLNLYETGFISPPHQQRRSVTEPDYNMIVLTEEGKRKIDRMIGSA